MADTHTVPTTAPVVSSRGNAPGSGGSTWTLAGLRFSPADPSAATGLGAARCRSVAWSSATSAVCAAGGSAAAGAGAGLTVLGLVGTPSLAFTFDGAPSCTPRLGCAKAAQPLH